MQKNVSCKQITILVLILLFLSSIQIPVIYAKVEKADKKTAGKSELKADEAIKNGDEADKKDAVAKDEKSVTLDSGAADETDESSGFRLFNTVKTGGPLMIFIAILGLVSLTIIIERLIYFSKNRIWNEESVVDDIRGRARNSKSQYLEELEDELRIDFQIYANGMERGLSLLSGIGNLSPIVGFLGTVIGMIDAFASIVAATTVNAKVVAAGIQVALVTTAGGLFVAAPTLAFFYLFSHVIQRRYANADETINEVCERLPRLSYEVHDNKKKAPSAGKIAGKKITGQKKAVKKTATKTVKSGKKK